RGQFPSRAPGNGRARGAVQSLGPDESAALRDRLLAEVGSLASADLATTWALGALGAKNRLMVGDAKTVEDAFEQRLCDLPRSEPITAPNQGTSGRESAMAKRTTVTESAESIPTRGIDESALAVPTPRRYRNREHLRFVIRQPCLICGRKPSDPHHLRHAQPRALGRKASDEFAVPLCRVHHREVHRVGDERAWWKAAGIDPLKAARKLWTKTRADDGRIGTNRPKRGLDSDQPPSTGLTKT